MNKKIISINQNRSFQRVYSKGISCASGVLITYILQRRGGQNLLGITTSKKIGNAVKRNRARRIIKEAYRQVSPSLKTGYFIVFVARGKTPSIKMNQVKTEMTRHFGKLGLIKRPERPANSSK
jgi:ribonuclease P protein component